MPDLFETVSSRSTRLIAVIIIGFAALYYLPGVLSPRHFWVEDEARYAEALREMLEHGHWLVLHLNGYFYPDKPPLYFWLSAVPATLFGQITPLGFLVVTWMSTVGSLLAVWLLAREIYNSRTGLWSCLLFATSFLVLICAQIVRMDMLLTLFVVLSVFSFHRGYFRKKRIWYLWMYLFSALAVLSKGPLGLIFPLCAAVGFLIQKRDWPELLRIFFHPGVAVLVLLVGGWLGLAWMFGYQEFVINLFVTQIAGRAVASFSHQEPVYFYILLLPLLFLPWTPYLPAAFKRLDTSGRGWSLLVWWFAIGLAVISAVSGKLFVYLLPLLPPLCILLGRHFDQQSSRAVKGLALPGLISAVIIFGLFSVLPFLAPYFPVIDQQDLWPLSVFFLPLLALGLVFGLKGRFKSQILLICFGLWLFSAYAFQSLLPGLDSQLTAKELGTEVAAMAEQGYEVGTFKVRRGILNFDAQSRLRELEPVELTHFLSQPKTAVIMRSKHLDRLDFATFRVFLRRSIAGMSYALVLGSVQGSSD